MEPTQIAMMLRRLPQSCVQDAIKGMPVSTSAAHRTLLEFENQGLVEWERGIPRISLTKRGERYLEALEK